MKKETLLLFCLLLTAGQAMGQVIKSHARALTPNKIETNATLEKILTANNGDLKQTATEAEGIISDTPEGDYFTLYRSTSSYYLHWGYINYLESDGTGNALVEGNDGYYYIMNPISSFNTSTWMKLEKTDDNTLVAHLPQPILAQTYDGVEYTYYLQKLNYTETDGYAEATVDTIDTDITFTISGDSILMQGDCMIGICDKDAQWTGYGDRFVKFSKHFETSTTLPEGLTTEEYEMDCFSQYNEIEKYVVKLAFDGDDVYMNSPYRLLPNAWIKGTLKDNIVSFPSRQYLGFTNFVNSETNWAQQGHFYFFGADVEEIEQDWEYIYQTTFHDSYDFTLDPETKRLTSTGHMVVNIGHTNPCSELQVNLVDPELYPYEMQATTILDPTWSVFNTYDEALGSGYFTFHIYYYDDFYRGVIGNVLNTDYIYYNIYIDDQLFTFSPDNGYDTLTEPMTDIPYTFTDNKYIMISNLDNYLEHSVTYFIDNVRNIGVKAIYNDPAGNHFESNIVTWGNIWYDAINTPSEIKKVDRVIYTDLSGRTISTPKKGIQIRTTVYADGTRKSEKILW